MQSRLRVGAMDWQWQVWGTQYYPDDLPTDWRLSYYANDFYCVLLAADKWLPIPVSKLEQWAESVTDDFRFYLLLPENIDASALPERLSALGGKLGGLLVASSQMPIELPPGIDVPVFHPVENDLPGCETWARVEGAGVVEVAILDVTNLDLRGQRLLLERLQPYLQQAHDTALILQADNLLPTEMKRFYEITELMGIA